MNQNKAYTNSANEINIVLWGPPRSGKKWLLWSFARGLEKLNQKNPDFRYELFEKKPGSSHLVPINVQTPSRHKIKGIQDFSWVFRRFPIVDDQAHRNSAFTHQLHISYIPGVECVGCLFDPRTYEAAIATLDSARGIIIAFDPKRLLEEKNSGKVSQTHFDLPQKKYWSKEEYVTVIRTLFEMIESRSSEKVILSACINKRDLCKEKGDPWDVIENMFGEQMKNLLRFYTTKLSLGLYTTSSFANFKSKKESEKKNMQPMLGDWDTFNTVTPFMHIFQEVEKKAFGMDNKTFSFISVLQKKSDYIPYPIENI